MNRFPLPWKWRQAPASSRERLEAWLALAAEEPEGTISPCPPPEQLAALVDARLAGEEREHLLEHLDRCPACYRAWLAVSATLPPVREVRSLRNVPRLAGLWALAAAAGLTLVLWMGKDPTDPGTLLTESYRLALARPVSPPPGELEPASGGFGFTGTGSPSPHRQALRNGMRDGRRELAGERPESSHVPGSPEYTLHELGRWIVLLQNRCTRPGEVSPELGLKLSAAADLFATLAVQQQEQLQDVPIGQGVTIIRQSLARVRQDPEAACREIAGAISLLTGE